MKANELMVGDLIYVYGRNGNMFSEPHLYIRKVTADWLADMEKREANDKKLTDNGIVIPNQLFIGDTKPVPLTDEILNMNGFEYTHRDAAFYKDTNFYVWCVCNYSYTDDERYSMYNQLGEWHVMGIKEISIRYVHELQHVLRLCGLTELANNFKIE